MTMHWIPSWKASSSSASQEILTEV